MPSTMGETLTVSVFGQSHSEAIGCVISGLPSGIRIDMDEVKKFMARRAPGQGAWTTPRKESDTPEVVSGLDAEGLTCGAPLACIIRNTNTRSQDYRNIAQVPRPGHSDFCAWTKWGSAHDIRGGGHFSGRLTAPLCFAGAIALQILSEQGVEIAAHLARIGEATDARFAAFDNSPEARALLARQIETVQKHETTLATIEAAASEAMLAQIDEARRAKDSVGGEIECVATGLPAGIGSPMFDGMENILARNIFGIPGVKGIEFGRGFEMARLHGSENNDPFMVEDGTCVPATNNAGGILGGITTGAPLVFKIAMKPTSSIAQAQRSVDLAHMEPAELEVHGRHDPCIVTRAVPVVEAVCALSLLDAWLTYPADTPFQKK
ncbi:MAG: chorismate synthase [Atopobiaceae bacterium]